MLILGKNINQQKVLCKIDRAITSEPRVCVSMSLLSSFRPKVQFFGQFILKCWHVCCTHPLSWIWEDTGIIQLILSLIIQLNDIYRQTASHGIWLASFTEVVFHFHITVVLLFPAPSPHIIYNLHATLIYCWKCSDCVRTTVSPVSQFSSKSHFQAMNRCCTGRMREAK